MIEYHSLIHCTLKWEHLIVRQWLIHSGVHHSLRVAVPSPRGKTGGRERLRKPDTNRVM